MFSYDFLFLCGIGSYFSCVISSFVHLGPVFMVRLAKGLSVLFIFLKNPLLISLIFSVAFLSLFYLFPLWCLLFPSFFWLWAWVFFFFLLLSLLGGRLDCLRFFFFPYGLPSSLLVKKKKSPPTNPGYARDAGWIPGLGRSLGVGNGNPLQYSCLENSTDRGT